MGHNKFFTPSFFIFIHNLWFVVWKKLLIELNTNKNNLKNTMSKDSGSKRNPSLDKIW